jgi:HlyD family secretion protein
MQLPTRRRTGTARRLGRAQRALLAVIAVSVLLSAGGLIGAAWVQSPAQIAAETHPPAPSLLTAQVTRQVVSQTLIARGTVQPTQQVQATPETEAGAQRLVITDVDRPTGSQVRAGDVIAVISGRPLFALPGRFPAWRNLLPGETGPDVAQLQVALAALGYPDGGDASGFYGPGTKQAVVDYYRSIGFTPITVGATAVDLTAAQQQVDSAQQALARDRAAAGKTGHAAVSARTRLSADEQQVSAAQRRYDGMAETSGPEVPMNEVVFVPSFPATVAAFGGGVGSFVTPPLVTLDVGNPDISAQLDPSDKNLMRVGQAVVADDTATGWKGVGRVSAVGPVSPGNQSAGSGTGQGNGVSSGSAPTGSGSQPYVPLTVSLSAAVPPGELGQDVQLVVTYASSAHPVLAVPEAAIRARPDGRTYVLRTAGPSRWTQVQVGIGLSGGGLVAITPMDGGLLAAGDTVVTGT